MKLLFFSPYYLPYISGITTYPDRLLRRLTDEYQITVITFNHSKNLKSQENFGPILVKRLPYFFKISKGFISLSSTWYFFQELKKTDLVVVNFPNFEALTLVILARLLGKKVIAIFHTEIEFGESAFEQILKFGLSTSVFLQALASHKIVGYSEDYSQKSWLYSKFPHKFVNILPPIETSAPDKNFLKKLMEKKSSNIWIGYSGRIAKQKGLEYLISAIKNLQFEGKKKITLMLAGPYGDQVAGEKNYYQFIKAELQKNKINFEFLGNQKPKELSAFYHSIDLLVLPSGETTESFGMVQAEAMLSGTPVVASNLPGVRQPILQTNMGELFESKNISSLTSAINKVIVHRSQYLKTDKAKQVFSISKSTAEWRNLLKKIIQDRESAWDKNQNN